MLFSGPYFYIGSTTLLLCRRKAGHVQNSKSQINQKCYKYFNEVGWNNVTIRLLEQYPCNSKEELVERENEWIKINIDNAYCLNSKRSKITYQELLQYNRDLRRKKASLKPDGRRKVTPEIKEQIINVWKTEKISKRALAKRFNLSSTPIYNIINELIQMSL
jgi:hypothetical protein